MFVKPDFAPSTYLGDDLTTQHCQDHIQNRCYPVQEWYIIYHLYVSLILPTLLKTLYSSLISSHECLCRPSPSSGSGSWQKRLEPEQTRWWLQLSHIYQYIMLRKSFKTTCEESGEGSWRKAESSSTSSPEHFQGSRLPLAEGEEARLPWVLACFDYSDHFPCGDHPGGRAMKFSANPCLLRSLAGMLGSPCQLLWARSSKLQDLKTHLDISTSTAFPLTIGEDGRGRVLSVIWLNLIQRCSAWRMFWAFWVLYQKKAFYHLKTLVLKRDIMTPDTKSF